MFVYNPEDAVTNMLMHRAATDPLEPLWLILVALIGGVTLAALALLLGGLLWQFAALQLARLQLLLAPPSEIVKQKHNALG